MNFNRRHFLTTALIGSAGVVYYFKGKKVSLFDDKVQVILATAYHLYPTSPLGFGVKEIHLASYLAFVLADKRILQEDRDYLSRGGTWIQEEALAKYGKSFLVLSHEQKEMLLQEIKDFDWGYNYIHYLFTYIFEAMFSAPIYGSNIKKITWKWSGHNPGFPQPSRIEDIEYE